MDAERRLHALFYATVHKDAWASTDCSISGKVLELISDDTKAQMSFLGSQKLYADFQLYSGGQHT